jgi:hypothetical protein
MSVRLTGASYSSQAFVHHDREVKVASARAWSGWIGFAGLMMLIIGAIDFFEGLIAVIRGEYYVIHGSQLIVFDTTTWGWITMILGVLLFLVGLGLAGGAGWARWTAIVLLVVNLIAQLSWLGNSAYPLWTLTVITLEIIVLYALTAKWSEAESLG